MGWAIINLDIFVYNPVSGNAGEIYDRETQNQHLVYLPLYPNCVQKCKWIDNKLIEGPIIIKTDSGQDRLAATLSSVESRERMWSKGVYPTWTIEQHKGEPRNGSALPKIQGTV